MKIVAIISMKYGSDRINLSDDLFGKPEIWWQYHLLKDIDAVDEIYCLVENLEQQEICKKYFLKYIAIKNSHFKYTCNVFEASRFIDADYYISAHCGRNFIPDDSILAIIPKKTEKEPYVCGIMQNITKHSEINDAAVVKLAVSDSGRCLYLSRMPIPYLDAGCQYRYKKYMEVECFNKAALEFFANTDEGKLEVAENIELLRFLENGVELHFKETVSDFVPIDICREEGKTMGLNFMKKMEEEHGKTF